MQNEIMVEVAYALPKEQLIIPVRVPVGTTAEDAIKLSGILQKFPDIDLAANKFGIFGKLTKPDTVLRELDRVEIYRPLIADPKEVRRQRAAEGKVMKKGGGDATPGAES
jgi:putative ubiquitin-RnfH superfamily antitoxin RatB of RatAB toxin-antitoxin module